MHQRVLAHGGRPPIPITIVGGPAGAGKTTLLRRLLGRNDGRRIAVVLDHPTALRIDSEIIAKSDDNSLLLRNGSVCLGLDGEIVTALSRVQAQPGLSDHVVIEASSDASFARMSGYAYMPGFRHGGNVLVLGAPEIARAQAGDRALDAAFAEQLRHAELLVLNHVDRIAPVARRAARRWLQQRVPRARVVESERCCVPTAMLLGVGLAHAPSHAVLGEWTPHYAVDIERRQRRISQPRNNDDYRAWVLTTRHPIDARAFRGWVNGLPDSILCADGVLRLSNEPRHSFQFHLCGSRWSLSPDAPIADTASASWISLVGLASSSAPIAAAARDDGTVGVIVDAEPAGVRRREHRLALPRSGAPS